MKRIYVSLLLAFVAAVTLSAQQTVVQNKELDSFSSVSVGGKFAFRLKSAPTYSVRIVSDERIADYVRPTVKNGTFTIVLDEKKYPAELKKALKANTEFVFDVILFVKTLRNLGNCIFGHLKLSFLSGIAMPPVFILLNYSIFCIFCQ